MYLSPGIFCGKSLESFSCVLDTSLPEPDIYPSRAITEPPIRWPSFLCSSLFLLWPILSCWSEAEHQQFSFYPKETSTNIFITSEAPFRASVVTPVSRAHQAPPSNCPLPCTRASPSDLPCGSKHILLTLRLFFHPNPGVLFITTGHTCNFHTLTMF